MPLARIAAAIFLFTSLAWSQTEYWSYFEYQVPVTRSASLKQVIEQANSGIGLTLRLRYDNNISQLMRRSDHWPFLNRGVPAVWVHTGLHPDYHTANDDADRINYPKMEKIVRLVYQMSWDLAQAEARPKLLPRR